MEFLFANTVVKGPALKDIADALEEKGLKAYLYPVSDDITAVYDEESEKSTSDNLVSPACYLSKKFGCMALSFFNHGSDTGSFLVAEDGEISGHYYFHLKGEDEEYIDIIQETDVEALADLFGAEDIEDLEESLNEPCGIDGADQCGNIADNLNIPHLAEGHGYKMIKEGLVNAEFEVESVVRVCGAEEPRMNYGSLLCQVLDEEKDISEIKKLISEGADVNAMDSDGFTPLIAAVGNGASIEIFQLLIDNGADVNAPDLDGKTALHWVMDEKEICKLLLDHGADVNAVDNDGCTPFHDEIDQDVLAIMIEHGADVNARSKDGSTPMHAVFNEAWVDYLVAEGADVNTANNEGLTPMHLACEPETAGALLENGALINITDQNGRTPLHETVESDNPDVAKFLLAKGADTNARDKDGKTPLDLAEENEFNDIAYLLSKQPETKEDPKQEKSGQKKITGMDELLRILKNDEKIKIDLNMPAEEATKELGDLAKNSGKLMMAMGGDEGFKHQIFPKATEADTQFSEDALGKKLPPSYRYFVRNFSNGANLYMAQEICGVGEKSPGDIPPIQDNVLDIEGDLPVRVQEGGKVSPQDLIAFTRDEDGNCWCFILDPDPSTGEYPVAYFDAMDRKLVSKVGSFNKWLGRLIHEGFDFLMDVL
jgi:ankyrin repeat protein